MQSRQLLWLSAVVLGLASCASPSLTPEQRAAIETRRLEQAAQIEREKREFEAAVANRIAADPDAPSRPVDPGFPAARCINPPLPHSVAALTFPAFGVAFDGVVCDNTEAGQKVLAWREWYCRGFERDGTRVRDCVISWWRNGQRRPVPAPGTYGGFGQSVERSVEFAGRQRGASVIFQPAAWQPGGDAALLDPDSMSLVDGDKDLPVRMVLAYEVQVQRGSSVFGGIDTYYVIDGDWAIARVRGGAAHQVPALVVSVRQGSEPGSDLFPRLFQFATNQGVRIHPGTRQGPNDNFTRWGARAVPQTAEPLPDQSRARAGYRLWRLTPAQALSRGEYGLRKERLREGYLFFAFGVD